AKKSFLEIDYSRLIWRIGSQNGDDDDIDDFIAAQLFDFENDPAIEIQTEEEHLSQKLSQLSASGKTKDKSSNEPTTTTTTAKKRPALTPSTATATTTFATTLLSSSGSTRKKLGTNEEGNEEGNQEGKEEDKEGEEEDENKNEDLDDKEKKALDLKIPKYLSTAYRAFEETISPVLKKNGNSMNIEDARTMAAIIDNLECVNVDKSLWIIYLQSGTGELQSEQRIITAVNSSVVVSNLQIWPAEVKAKMIKHGHTTTTNPNDIDHESCVDYVHRVLIKYQNLKTYYETNLQDIKQRLSYCLTDEIEQIIIKFVQQHGITLYRVPVEGLIAVVEYDYKDRLIQSEFYLENYSEYQRQVFENLCKSKRERETTKVDVAVLKQRIAHNHLPKSFDSLQIPEPITLSSINDTKTRQRLSDRCEKILQRARSDMILIYIAAAEAKMNEWKEKFDKDLAEMKEYLKFRRTSYVSLQIEASFFRHSSDGQELDLVHRWSSFIDKSKIRFSPTLCRDSHQHHLSSKQMELLHRGPSYVLPCQLHILSESSLNMDHILTKQMASLRRELTRVFTKYPVDLSRRMNFEKEIQNLFHASFNQSIPSTLEERIFYEKQLIKSIRYQLNKDQLILRRTADNYNTYYLGPLNEFQQKSDDFVQHSTSYEFIGLLQALYTFLAHPLVSTRHKRLSYDATHELTALVLRNNFFSYDDKIYRFTKGCPLNLPLTDLLGDIYLYDWQFPLVRQSRLNDLFYGRYHNIGLMTWYEPIEQLQTIFDELERLLPSGAQLTSFIATTVHFMDCLIDNQRGNLFTNVYHDSTVRPFLLLYIPSYARLSHRKWLRYVFIHAFHYCCSFEDFEDERIYIEAIFLANRYALDFVEYHWRQFLKRFNFSLIELTDLNR
ncbi:unnamed protein product, partial [Rotaria socialis]